MGEEIRYITPSVLLDDEVRQVLRQGRVLVTGQPLRHISSDQERFFEACEFVVDLPLFVKNTLVKVIPRHGHNHIPESYIGEYPMLIGNPVERPHEEYFFGIRPELGFTISLV